MIEFPASVPGPEGSHSGWSWEEISSSVAQKSNPFFPTWTPQEGVSLLEPLVMLVGIWSG